MTMSSVIYAIFLSIGATFLYHCLVVPHLNLKSRHVKGTTALVFVLYALGQSFIFLQPHTRATYTRAVSLIDKIDDIMYIISNVGYIVMIYFSFRKIERARKALKDV